MKGELSVNEHDNEVIEGMQTIVLTRRESIWLFELMENPPPRNEAFLRAQARHHELLGGQENENPHSTESL